MGSQELSNTINNMIRSSRREDYEEQEPLDLILQKYIQGGDGFTNIQGSFGRYIVGYRNKFYEIVDDVWYKLPTIFEVVPKAKEITEYVRV